ncbi:MAG: S-methyl-5-thioribose-1-phosphate isomerase [Sulfolobaceae archaeon]
MVSFDEVKRIYRPKIRPIEWIDSRNLLRILDQSLLPFDTQYVDLKTEEEVALAIKQMKVRGAPAIGISAAYGMLLSLISKKPNNLNESLKILERAKQILDSSRPTAVNLFWATSRMLNLAKESIEQGKARSVNELVQLLKYEANRIFEEEFEAELRIGYYGLEKIEDGDVILTQCNAGGLATGTGLGTALAPVKIAHSLGIKVAVIAPETRPWLQGSRLTVYELMMENIPVTLITDTAIGLVMYKNMVNSVMVGADRILRDGHVFNKIGTFKEAVIAHELGIPFYVLAPLSSFDMKSNVNDIVIEERDPNEVRTIRGIPIAPSDVKVYNPVFDVTPPKYITAIITEKGVIHQPLDKNIKRIIEGKHNEI